MSSSVHRPLLAVFLCKLLGVLHELSAIFSVFLRQVGPQGVFGLGGVHQSDETLNHCRRQKLVSVSISHRFGLALLLYFHQVL